MLFPFFLDNYLHLLIPAANAKVFPLSAKLVIPTGTPTNEANTEIENHPLIAELQIIKC